MPGDYTAAKRELLKNRQVEIRFKTFLMVAGLAAGVVLLILVPSSWRPWLLALYVFVIVDHRLSQLLAEVAVLRRLFEAKQYPLFSLAEIEEDGAVARIIDAANDEKWAQFSDKWRTTDISEANRDALLREQVEVEERRLNHLRDMHLIELKVLLNARVSSGRMSIRRARHAYTRRLHSHRLLHWLLRADRRQAKREELL